jgi:hypothetical protein
MAADREARTYRLGGRAEIRDSACSNYHSHEEIQGAGLDATA